MNTMLTKLVQFSSLTLTALSTGVFYGTRVSMGPSNKDFSLNTYIEVQQAGLRNVATVMKPLLPGAVAANIAVLALSAQERRSPAFALNLGGSVSNAAVLVVTGLLELPINTQMLSWSPENPPANWEALRDRWDAVHTIRTAISVVGFGCLAAAVLVPPARPDSD